MFRIKYIEIFAGCTGLKNLEPGKYTFVSEDYNEFPANFFGHNISVSAIVGKNGSGKTSVLDILYRVLNNLCAMMNPNLNKVDYPAFSYILGVKAEVGYSISKDGARWYGTIKCNDNSISIDMTDPSGENEDVHWRFGNGHKNEGLSRKKFSDIDRATLAKELFYCIVVNYAPFALNSLEYEHETSLSVNSDFIPDKIDIRNHNWLQSIFHKNDGYQSNITLVPYRDYGKFDAYKESKLSRERILEILCVHPDFIEGYKLARVHFSLNEDRFRDKFSLTRPTASNGYKPSMEIHRFILEFEQNLEDYVLGGPETIATRILAELGYGRNNIMIESRPHLLSYLYLVYKVLNCAQYPSFSEYSALNDTDLAIDRDRIDLLDKARLLARAVKTEHSHITFKIERVLAFLPIIDCFDWNIVCSQGFDLTEYVSYLDRNRQPEANLIPVAMKLPPSFFDFEIFLLPDHAKGNGISFERLSSGERQFYVSISSIIYHAMNLISIPERHYRVKYRNLLVVLDEVELCFHPDFQRIFIDRLLSTIKRLKFNDHLSFHILLTSHSPFILSDIPASNILYLENGKNVGSDYFINPFCANINDILSQSFFLDKDGFIGEHAKRIIRSLYDFLSGKNTASNGDIDWNKSTAKCVIDTIGEPLIRESLRGLYITKFKDSDALKAEIRRLQEELRSFEEDNQ